MWFFGGADLKFTDITVSQIKFDFIENNYLKK